MKKGFTLIEILVSVAIFAVVMVIALGALLSISVSDRKAEAIKSVVNNLNFALDSMSRAIRTGQNYHCDVTVSAPPVTSALDCPVASNRGANSIAFLSGGTGVITGVETYYRLDTSNVAGVNSTCGQTSPNIGCIERSFDNASWTAITDPEVVITDFSPNGYLFYVVGAPTGDGLQPKVTITLSGHVQVSATQQSAFNLQTTVTQRVYDQ